MMPLKLRTALDRNRLKQKHDENMIYRPRAIRGVIYAKIKQQDKSIGGNRDRNELQGDLTTGWHGQQGARATRWCGASGLRFQLVFVS
jgi:hypothetical protein